MVCWEQNIWASLNSSNFSSPLFSPSHFHLFCYIFPIPNFSIHLICFVLQLFSLSFTVFFFYDLSLPWPYCGLGFSFAFSLRFFSCLYLFCFLSHLIFSSITEPSPLSSQLREAGLNSPRAFASLLLFLSCLPDFRFQTDPLS